MKDHSFTTVALREIKSAGYRITAARRAVIDALAHAKKPLSAHQLHNQLQKNADTTDIVSVYRVLEVLAQLELVHNDIDSNGYFACTHCADCPSDIHIFVKCIECLAVEELDFHEEVFSEAFKKRLKKMKSKPLSEKIYLQDICESCRA